MEAKVVKEKYQTAQVYQSATQTTIMENYESSKQDLTLHKKMCQGFFKHIKNGCRLYINVDWEFPPSADGLYLSQENISLTPYLHISILTDEIIDYDSQVFEMQDRAYLLYKYRPYFVSFAVPIEENNIEELNSLGENWWCANFSDSASGFQNIESEENILLSVILETASSPVTYVKGQALIFKNQAISPKILDKINSTYDVSHIPCTPNDKIEKELNSFWQHDHPHTIDIYNVGHGNADYIRGKNKHRLLYDIGYDYPGIPAFSNPKYPRATKALRNIKPTCVILSHWDLDHVIGYAYANQYIFSRKWFAPSFCRSPMPKNQARLANYLYYLGNLYLIDRTKKNNPIATIQCSYNTRIILWLGIGTDHKLTEENKTGLYLSIQSGSFPNILLAGDVPYGCMLDFFNLHIPVDFMHVPHHGSDMKLGPLRTLLQTPVHKGDCAIISTNRNVHTKKSNTYLPNLNVYTQHFNILKSKFRDVQTTLDHVPQDDDANLSIRINYQNGSKCFR